MIDMIGASIQPLEKAMADLVEQVLSDETDPGSATREIEIAPEIISLGSENLLAK